jgi:hypothetical protein
VRPTKGGYATIGPDEERIRYAMNRIEEIKKRDAR